MFVLFQCCGWAMWLLRRLEMDSWRQKFIDARDRLQDDEDEDDFALRWVVGLDLGSSSRSKRPRVHGGSKHGKAQNVERDRED